LAIKAKETLQKTFVKINYSNSTNSILKISPFLPNLSLTPKKYNISASIVRPKIVLFSKFLLKQNYIFLPSEASQYKNQSFQSTVN
jgi:hypothetical protein